MTDAGAAGARLQPRAPAAAGQAGHWSPGRRFAATPAQAWANGAGRTTELRPFEESTVAAPPAPAPWRLSVARLERPARFSALPGVRRIFLPVGGAVELLVDGLRRRVAEGAATQFDGSAEVELLALAVPCHAVNLMQRSGVPGERLELRSWSVRPPDQALALVALTAVHRGAPAREGAGREQGAQPFDLLLPAASPVIVTLPDRGVAVVPAGSTRASAPEQHCSDASSP